MMNNYDIIWKYRKNRVGFLITLIILLISTIFCCYLLIEGINKYLSRGDTSFFMNLMLLFGIIFCLYPPYRLIDLLNQKTLYIAKEYIVFERYIGKTIIEPLGVSYTSDYLPVYGGIMLGMCSVLTFNRIDSKNYKKISFILALGSDNLEELYSYLLPKIEIYLIGLQEKEYIECKIFLNLDGRMNYRIDFDKIEKLRKEKKMKNNTQTQYSYISLEFCFFQQDFSQIPITRRDLGSTGTFINYSMVVAGTGSNELLSKYMDSQGVSKIVNTLYKYKLTGNFGVFSYLFKKAEGKSDGTTSGAWLANGNATSYRVENLKQGEEKMSETNNNEIPNTESKKLESKTQENRKLDSNGDEIIWQIQYDIPIINNIISWGLRIGWVTLLCYFFSLGLMKYIEQYEQYSKMEWYKQAIIIGLGIVFAILIWNLLIVILQTLNLKTIYVTNDNLIIQKYFGKNVALSLGSFYVVFKTLYRAFETEYAIIRTFDGSTSFTFGIAKNHKNFRAHGIKNIEELEKILKPKIEKYLITLEEKYFQDFLSFDYQYIYGGDGNIMLLDMENILRLRKETDCGK